jgi:sulfite reductase (ferredoxin)
MSNPNSSWKEALASRLPAQMASEIDEFENVMQLRKQGKIEEKVFAELRLRRGAYGQRYDNGHRYDGVTTQEIPFPRRGLTKGPDTEFDAPGMQRIKIPFGKMTADQLEVLADCAEEYSNAILHVTTRQDIQLHFVDIEDTPDMHRRLGSVGITTREACGNSVRNVTGCPLAGICTTEAFDISPYARAEHLFLLGHPDVQDFGRKFKIAYSGCAHLGCGRVMLHDLGFIAGVQGDQRGFKVVVGGGLGPVPHVAKVLYEFMPEAQMLPVSQAISRVYARLGEKRNRAKARIKFLVAQLGIDEFRRLVDAELEVLEHDPRWQQYIDQAEAEAKEFKPAPVTSNGAKPAAGFEQWVTTNVYKQRQPGFVAATINLPLGDITTRQSRKLADILRKYTNEAMRTTVDQNLLIRWVHEQDLVSLYNDLHEVNLSLSGSGTITDVTSCPGTDTCKLGISSSRGLSAELRSRLEARNLHLDETLKHVNIRVSGCNNSCGQHHVSDIGFYGSSRNVGAYKVPHFLLVLGGELADNAGNYGLAIGAIPSKNAPAAVDRLLDLYSGEKQNGETFRGWVMRVGKKVIKEKVQDLINVPAYEDDKSYYVDWHDSREYSIGDIGVGECAGEVISLTQFSLASAESKVFDASVTVDDPNATAADIQDVGREAYQAMTLAALGLLKTRNPDAKPDPNTVFTDFKKQFIDTGVFFERYIGNQEWPYYQAAHESKGKVRDKDEARRRVEEAQLFIDASHACYARILASQSGGAAAVTAALGSTGQAEG